MELLRFITLTLIMLTLFSLNELTGHRKKNEVKTIDSSRTIKPDTIFQKKNDTTQVGRTNHTSVLQ